MPKTAVETFVETLPAEVACAFLAHISGGTSANYLADWTRRWGHPVSATAIKSYRKKVVT